MIDDGAIKDKDKFHLAFPIEAWEMPLESKPDVYL
jgi:hypothetical protein